MWVLILTLVAPSASGGSSIHHISGFQTEASCVAAGQFWQNNIPSTWSRSAALCVKQ